MSDAPFTARTNAANLLAFSPAQLLGAVSVVAVSAIAYLVVYRLVLSPVAKFPGPKLAGLTFWYEFYYDVVLNGRYVFKIMELHEKYGPIVRINPQELHVADPAFYSKLFAGPTEKRDKWDWAMKMFGPSGATFATVPHELHRHRRAALNPFFSKAAVMRLEPQLTALLEQLCRRFQEFRESGQPATLGPIFSALTTDVITMYAFGEAYGGLNAPDFNPEMYEAVQGNTKVTVIAKQFPWFLPLMRALPQWFVKATNPSMMQMIYLIEYCQKRVKYIMENFDESKAKSSIPATIFHGILDGDVPPIEKGFDRLVDDGVSVVAAGLLTSADTLRVITFHILDNPEVLRSLKAELDSAIPNPAEMPPLRVLENLPYLSAVMTEGYRISCGVCGRLQRVSPHAPLTFNDWVIPPGTPVSMSSMFLHYKSDVFPEPHLFRPDRWLDLDREKASSGDRLDNYLVPFSRGTRACVGINLAQAEICLTLSYLFRRFDLSLYETTRADVDIEHDFFTAFPRLDSKGVRVTVK